MEEWAIQAILTAWTIGAVAGAYIIGRKMRLMWPALLFAGVVGLVVGPLVFLASSPDPQDNFSAVYAVFVIAGLVAVGGVFGARLP